MLRFLIGSVLALLGLWLMIQLLPVLMAFVYVVFMLVTK
jgi:hypothetical protein